jgi:hypothetical protein
MWIVNNIKIIINSSFLSWILATIVMLMIEMFKSKKDVITSEELNLFNLGSLGFILQTIDRNKDYPR